MRLAHTETWRDHTATARRTHIFGRIVPMERPADEPPLWLGVIILAASILSLIAAVAFASAIFAPARSLADAPASDAMVSPVSVVEAGAGNGERP